jgi:myb proto-oncogene protein
LALPGRSNKDCRKRWHNSVAEGLRKGQWSKSEDQSLINGVHRYGSRWTMVAKCVSSRSADQCAKRWQQSLDPCLDRSEWREHEDTALLKAVDRLGRHWKDIQQQYLPHRSKNCVKNRYSVLARRNAIQIVPYDDSLCSSSSDPGTPPQMDLDVPIVSTAMPLLRNNTQAPPIPNPGYGTSTDDMSWAWSGLGDPNVLMTTSHISSFAPDCWPTSCNSYDANIYSPHPDQWNNTQPTIFSSHQTQDASIANQPQQGHMYPSHQQPHISSLPFYAPLPPNPNATSSRAPNPSSQRGWSQQQYRDSAPFG